MQIKLAGALPLEVKADDGNAAALHIKGYGAAFGNVDSWGDIIAPGAFDAYLASENKARTKLCYQHDFSEVIGKVTSLSVDETGLLFEADIIDTTAGADVAKLLKAGAIDEFSIGYYADSYHFEKRAGYDTDIRILDAVTVAEISPVTRAANPKAVLLDAKDEEGTHRALATMSDEDFKALKGAVADEEVRRLAASL